MCFYLISLSELQALTGVDEHLAPLVCIRFSRISEPHNFVLHAQEKASVFSCLSGLGEERKHEWHKIWQLCHVWTMLNKDSYKGTHKKCKWNIFKYTSWHWLYSFICTIIKKNHTFLKTPSKPFIHSLLQLLSVLYLKTSTTFQLL